MGLRLVKRKVGTNIAMVAYADKQIDGVRSTVFARVSDALSDRRARRSVYAS